ncbi:MAG TPA: hypothetical protein VIE66_16295 [Methylocella sp.]
MIRSTFTLRPNHIRDLHEIINRPIPNAGAQLYRGVFTRDGAYQRPNSGDDNSTARVNTEPAGGVCVTPVAFEVTLFVNNAGPLSKHVFLDPDGSLIKIPYAQMWCGTMARRPLSDLHAFARLIEDMPRNAAIALGAKQEGLLDCDQLVLSDDLRDGQPGFASRSQKNIAYRREKPALVLLDFDDGGMPSAVKTRLEELGGFLGAVKYLCHDITTSRHHDIGLCSPALDKRQHYQWRDGTVLSISRSALVCLDQGWQRRAAVSQGIGQPSLARRPWLVRHLRRRQAPRTFDY